MNQLTAYSLTGLVILFVLAEVSGIVFKIRKDSFYSWFHFVGGAITFLFWYSLLGQTNSKLITLLLTIATGIAWEIYEWLSWKYIYKVPWRKPKKKDTISDLILDTLGAALETVLIGIFL